MRQPCLGISEKVLLSHTASSSDTGCFGHCCVELRLFLVDEGFAAQCPREYFLNCVTTFALVACEVEFDFSSLGVNSRGDDFVCHYFLLKLYNRAAELSGVKIIAAHISQMSGCVIPCWIKKKSMLVCPTIGVAPFPKLPSCRGI